MKKNILIIVLIISLLISLVVIYFLKFPTPNFFSIGQFDDIDYFKEITDFNTFENINDEVYFNKDAKILIIRVPLVSKKGFSLSGNPDRTVTVSIDRYDNKNKTEYKYIIFSIEGYNTIKYNNKTINY